MLGLFCKREPLNSIRNQEGGACNKKRAGWRRVGEDPESDKSGTGNQKQTDNQ